MAEVRIRMKGEMEDSSIEKNCLNINCHPVDFVEAFLPFEDNKYLNQKRELISMKQLIKVCCAGEFNLI